jgi:hypothetical protein
MKTINLITGAHPNFMKIAPMLEFLQPLLAQAEPLERMLALEQRFFLADHNLIYTDKMSMTAQLRAACGVRCVQRALGLRDWQDERDGREKRDERVYCVRRAASMRVTPCCRCCVSKSGAGRFSMVSRAYQHGEWNASSRLLGSQVLGRQVIFMIVGTSESNRPACR